MQKRLLLALIFTTCGTPCMAQVSPEDPDQDAAVPSLEQAAPESGEQEGKRSWWPFGKKKKPSAGSPDYRPPPLTSPGVDPLTDPLQDVEWSGNAKWWWRFTGPSKPNPAAQMEHARSLEEKDKMRRARRAYQKIAQFWPESDEAPRAQIRYAELLADAGHYQASFKAYQELIKRFAGQFPYQEVLDKQLWLAQQVEDIRVGRFLLFGGIKAPTEAVPLYRQIITNAPQWEKSAESQYRIGEIYHEEKALKKAIEAFTVCATKYHGTPYSEKAAFGRAECMYRLAEKSPNDDTAAETAWAALTLYLNQYPQSENSVEAFELMQNMRRRLARSFYEKAKYYDDLRNNERAALIAYEALVEEFPESEWTNIANSRIKSLRRKID